MHGGRIERVLAVHDAQEARRLLERLGAEARHLLQGDARLEGAVLVAEGDDVGGKRLIEARHVRQQRRRGRVDVDADRVDAILDHRIERARETALVDVVLILPDADGLGLDLDELGQRDPAAAARSTPRRAG